MANPVSRFATRVAYGASQLPRVAWYVGHSVIMRRLSEAAHRSTGKSTRTPASTDAPVPDRRRLYASAAVLNPLAFPTIGDAAIRLSIVEIVERTAVALPRRRGQRK